MKCYLSIQWMFQDFWRDKVSQRICSIVWKYGHEDGPFTTPVTKAINLPSIHLVVDYSRWELCLRIGRIGLEREFYTRVVAVFPLRWLFCTAHCRGQPVNNSYWSLQYAVSGGGEFFSVPLFGLRNFFFSYFYISLWKFIKIYYFFKWGCEENRTPDQ